MPSPVAPSDVAAALPQVSGDQCAQFKKLISFPQQFHDFLEYAVDESGYPTDEFKADLCALGCFGGGGTPNASMPAPTGINATDGSFSDKVQVSWNAVVPPDGIDAVTAYKVYRALATESNPNSATLIATVTAPTVTYDDEDVDAGTTYNYWVKATNVTETSAFSGSDVGSADAPTTSLDAISDLLASVGYGDSRIRITWTPPTGATSYDIYRATTDDFGAATIIHADYAPTSTTILLHPTDGGGNEFWTNCGGDVLLFDTPPSAAQDYYFFVVAKKSSPPAVSPESNSALGRVQPPAIYNTSQTALDWSTTSYIIPGGISKMRIVAYGAGGGGAGGSGSYGGGGGGGGAVIIETFTVAPTDTISLVTTPSQENSGNAASTVDGEDGALLELKINGVTVTSIPGGHGGAYSASGGGNGGLGDTGTGYSYPTIYDGYAGEDASGANGGRSGHIWGARSVPMANGLSPGSTGNSYAGAGAKAISINPAISVGGYGLSGSVRLQFGV